MRPMLLYESHAVLYESPQCCMRPILLQDVRSVGFESALKERVRLAICETATSEEEEAVSDKETRLCAQVSGGHWEVERHGVPTKTLMVQLLLVAGSKLLACFPVYTN